MLNNGDSVSRVFSVGSIRLSARSPRGTHLLVVLGGGGSHCSDCLLATTPKQKMLPFRPLLNRPGSIVEFPEPETLKLCGHKRSPNK